MASRSFTSYYSVTDPTAGPITINSKVATGNFNLAYPGSNSAAISAGSSFSTAGGLSGTTTYSGYVYGDGIVVQNGSNFYLYSNDNTLTASSTVTQSEVTSLAIESLCFLSGTHIATPTGEVLVEDLKVGDVISTYDGDTRKVFWIGRQVKSRFFSDTQRDLPVEIAAGALGDNLPVRPLRLSPDHAILIDGIIAHASALVNNGTIRFMTKNELPDTFTYYHIETEDHALILAEGVASETFVDNVSRRKFNNWNEYVELYGENERPIYEMDYPRAHSHRQVPQHIKDRIGEPEIDISFFKRRAG